MIKRILKIIKNGDDKSQQKLLYCIALINVAIILVSLKITFYYDSGTYYSAGEVFWNGGIDEIRTPIYPLICALTSRISGYSVWIIAAMQMVLYFVSIHYLYKLTAFFISKKSLQFVCTAMYTALPCFSAYIVAILTESFALSLTIIFSYYTLLYIKSSDCKASIISNILLAIMLMLRPSFIFLLPLLVVLQIILILKHKKFIVNVIGMCAVLGIYFSYSYAYNQQHGIFATSSVGYVNQIMILNHAGLLDYSEIDKTWFDNKEINLGIVDICKSIPPKEKERIVKHSVQKNLKAYIFETFRKFIHLGNEPCFYVYATSRIEALGGLMIRSTMSLSITFMMVYVLLLIYALFISKTIKKGKMPLLNIYIWCFITGVFVTAIIGAPGDYPRLVFPCTPFILISILQLLDKVKIIKQNWKFE